MYSGNETVKKEYPRIGGYRVRLLETGDGVKLDVREYVDGGAPGTFEGFTRKGIRLDGEGMLSLYRALSEVFAPARPAAPAPAAVAPAPVRAPRPVKAPAPAPSMVKARAADLAPVVTPGPIRSAAAEALLARMRSGATVPLAEFMTATAAPGAPAASPAPAPKKPAPVPSPDAVRKILDGSTPSGIRIGDTMMAGILEETEQKLSHV